MQFATWNVNSLAVRLPQLLDWLAAHPVDALVLQETKLTDDKFPQAEIEAAGYRVAFHGQKTYNGVALLSREPPATSSRTSRAWPTSRPASSPARWATHGSSAPISRTGRRRAARSSPTRCSGSMRCAPGSEELARHPQLVLMGDFNIAPEDRDVYDPVAWAGQIHCTPEERAHFQQLLGLGLSDAFRLFEQPPRAGAGGTTATWPSARTRACASTTSWSARRSSPACRPARSTRRRARTNAPATMPR
jgi:exodeoxyribonuclease-3